MPVLIVSVPPRDVPIVREHLPEATVVEEPLSPGLAERHPDTEVLSVMVHDPVSAETLAHFPRLNGVVTRSTGFDHLPLDHLRARGIVALNLGGYATPAVTNLTVMFIIALLRRVPEAMAVTQGAFRGGTDPPTWDRSRLVGRGLADVKVGVLGTGRIGSEVVRALSTLGATVLAHDLRPDDGLRTLPRFQYVETFTDLLSASDVLTLHVPLTAETRHMIGQHALALLPRGAVLVNTARGRIVDDLAVERALRSGRLGGFATDVLRGEPSPPNLPRFRDLPNVIITPHLGAYDQGTIRERYRVTARLARAIIAGDNAAFAGHTVDDRA